MRFGEATRRQKNITEQVGVQSKKMRQEKIQGPVGG